MSSATHPRLVALLSVTAEADPQLPARLLALLSNRNRLPLSFRCELRTSGQLEIELRAEIEAPAEARRLSALARRIPTVLSATASVIERPPNRRGAPLEERLRAEGLQVRECRGPLGTREFMLQLRPAPPGRPAHRTPAAA